MAILEIKEIARSVTENQALLLAEKALGMYSATEIERLLGESYPRCSVPSKRRTIMAETKEHLEKFADLSEKVMALAKSIRQAEKDLKSQWVDEVEQRDLQDVKDHMDAVEDALRMLREEMCHIEAEHCREARQKL